MLGSLAPLKFPHAHARAGDNWNGYRGLAKRPHEIHGNYLCRVHLMDVGLTGRLELVTQGEVELRHFDIGRCEVVGNPRRV